jgi:hypothetical protein
MPPEAPSLKTQLAALHREGVFAPAYWVGAFGIMVVSAHVIWLAPQGVALSNDPAAWGQFGDYFGGILNPVCAYMAFIWLVRSYSLQKTELAETRKALEESREAQQEQARLALLSAKTQALSIRLTAVGSQLSALRDAHSRAIDSANAKGFEYAVVSDEGTYVNVQIAIAKLNDAIQTARKIEDGIIVELNKIDTESTPLSKQD